MNSKKSIAPDSDGKELKGLDLRSGFGPLLLLSAIFFLNFTARVVYAPLMPEIEANLDITHAAAGSLFFYLSIGYFITLLGSGWIAASLNHRRTIILSSVVLGLTLIFTAFSSSLLAIRITLLLLGAGAGLYLPSGIATLTGLINPRYWGKAIAVHELAPNLGFMMAPLLSELIMVWFSWRAVPVMLGMTSILLGVMFARYGRGGSFTGAAPGLASFKIFLAKPPFWILVVLFGLGVAGTLGVYTMLPLYLVTDHAIDRNLANTLVSFSRVSCLFMAFAGGWASDRFGPRQTMIVVFLVSGMATIAMGATSGDWVLWAIFIQPMASVCFFPAGFAALSRIGPPEARNIAVSLAVPFAFMIGGGAVPIFIGFMGDVASFTIGICLVGGMIILGAILAYFLKL
ncbi:MAG: MFS transporter [Thermodesulfobacteriota bacterium]|nr:MFS transporter [Thermodesulfobacteriota bacterium]